MKKYLRHGIVVVIATLFQPVSANGQLGWISDIFLQIEDSTCTTYHFEVVCTAVLCADNHEQKKS